MRRAVERGDVAVVAERDQRGADRGVDVTVGLVGRRERGVEQLREQLADLRRPSGRRCERIDLGIGPKSRRGGFDGVEFGVDLVASARQRVGIGDDDLHVGAPALPMRCRGLHAGLRDPFGGGCHEPCDTVTCGEKFGAITVVGVRLRRLVVGGVSGLVPVPAR